MKTDCFQNSVSDWRIAVDFGTVDFGSETADFYFLGTDLDCCLLQSSWHYSVGQGLVDFLGTDFGDGMADS